MKKMSISIRLFLLVTIFAWVSMGFLKASDLEFEKKPEPVVFKNPNYEDKHQKNIDKLAAKLTGIVICSDKLPAQQDCATSHEGGHQNPQ